MGPTLYLIESDVWIKFALKEITSFFFLLNVLSNSHLALQIQFKSRDESGKTTPVQKPPHAHKSP